MSHHLSEFLELKKTLYNLDKSTGKTAKLVIERDQIIQQQRVRIEQLELEVKRLSEKNLVSAGWRPLLSMDSSPQRNCVTQNAK